MIKVTVKQLVDAAQSGAYGRFANIRKTITAGHKNRKMPMAVLEELKHFETARAKIIEECEGKLSKDKTRYEFGEKAAEFTQKFDELMAQPVDDLPGDAIKLADLLDGGLLESDYALLEPFLGE